MNSLRVELWPWYHNIFTNEKFLIYHCNNTQWGSCHEDLSFRCFSCQLVRLRYCKRKILKCPHGIDLVSSCVPQFLRQEYKVYTFQSSWGMSWSQQDTRRNESCLLSFIFQHLYFQAPKTQHLTWVVWECIVMSAQFGRTTTMRLWVFFALFLSVTTKLSLQQRQRNPWILHKRLLPDSKVLLFQYYRQLKTYELHQNYCYVKRAHKSACKSVYSLWPEVHIQNFFIAVKEGLLGVGSM